jgi:hypothetical protein
MHRSIDGTLLVEARTVGRHGMEATITIHDEPARSSPWSEPDWWPAFTAWIGDQLIAARIRRQGAPTHVRSWARSALASIETDHGRFWAKQVPAVFAHEIAVTGLLTDVDPGSVAPTFAVDVPGGRMMTSHVDGPLLADVRDAPEAWAATLVRLAELQRVLATDPAALAVAGVTEAPIADLATSVGQRFDDERLTRTGEPDGLTTDETARLQDRAGAVADACNALAASGVPDSLDHGDLSARQVIVCDMGPVILDWSDGSVTHPFLSAAAFLDDERRPTTGVPPRAELVDAYLGPWVAAGHLSLDDGRQAVDLASIVLPVHVAALYAERVLPGLGWPDDPDLTKVVPALLRRLL